MSCSNKDSHPLDQLWEAITGVFSPSLLRFTNAMEREQVDTRFVKTERGGREKKTSGWGGWWLRGLPCSRGTDSGPGSAPPHSGSLARRAGWELCQPAGNCLSPKALTWGMAGAGNSRSEWWQRLPLQPAVPGESPPCQGCWGLIESGRKTP